MRGPDESQPTESRDDAEAHKDFWSNQGDSIYRHHNEPRVEVYVPKKNVLMTVGMSTKQKFLRLLERIYKIHPIDRHTSERIHMVRGETDKNSKDNSTRSFWPEAWTKIGKAVQTREKQEWALEKPKT